MHFFARLKKNFPTSLTVNTSVWRLLRLVLLSPSPPRSHQMNVRQLCFFQVSKASGKSWLWWDYTDGFGTNCSMAAKLYTAACAAQVGFAGSRSHVSRHVFSS